MKKFTLLLSALLMVSFLALAQIKMIVHLNDAEPIEVYANSVDSITFVDEATDPDTPVSPVPPTIPTKIKANWLTYTSDSHQDLVNVVYKTVTTRGEDAKFKKEYTNYKNEEPIYKYIVENEGNKDMYQTVPINPGPIDRWTIVWYDDARTKQKEYESIHLNEVYDYDNQERLIAIRSYYDGVLTYDAEFRYEGLVRYGIRTHMENGTIYRLEKDTITFYNNTFADEAVKEYRGSYEDEESISYYSTKYEMGDWGYTKLDGYSADYDKSSNNLLYEGRTVRLYTWHDELYCTYTEESYSKYRYINEYVEITDRRNGYFKYRYGGDSTTPDTPEEPTDQPGKESFVAKPFSVSATETVTFSPGNLQYHAANDEWRFAPNQTDYIGEANENISSNYNGWIDLFGWGTGNNPTNASTDYDDYQTFVDWGVNKIGNDAPNTWRTLTVDEWDYLIDKRTNASQLMGVAQVNGVNGLILLPDNWICPSGVTFKSGFHYYYGTDYYAEYQTFSASEWSKLEASGAVFLSAAGYRSGSDLYFVQNFGHYWSATEYGSFSADYLGFGSDGAGLGGDARYSGRSVRLVKGEVTEDEPEEDPLKPVDPSLPTVLGTAGKYTIAFKIPEALECDPIINFFGPFQDGYDISDPDAPVAEKIEVEGSENWYKVVFEAADPAQANGKLCPQMGGVGTWNAQGTYTLIKGEAEIKDDYGKSNHISCKEAALGQVVYVDVTKWALNPCNRPNEAGPATYEVIIKTDFPADLDPYNDIIVSATVDWYTDAMEMTYDPFYTGQGLRFTGSVDECPANEVYKYVISYKGSYWIYEKGDNRIMPYGNKAKDEVTEWDSEPWNPVPGGIGTFEIELCEAPEGEVYIAGNFTEEGEAGWWGACAGNSAYKMTKKEGNVYTWTGEYPENFMFKVIDYVDDYNMSWYGGSGDTFILDGENFTFTCTCGY